MRELNTLATQTEKLKYGNILPVYRYIALYTGSV